MERRAVEGLALHVQKHCFCLHSEEVLIQFSLLSSFVLHQRHDSPWLQCKGKELDQYDLFSGDRQGSLCKTDLDKRGPHLEFSAWGLTASMASPDRPHKCMGWPVDTSPARWP